MRTALKTVLDLYSRSIRSTATPDPVIVPFRVQLLSTVPSNGLRPSFPLLEKSLPKKLINLAIHYSTLHLCRQIRCMQIHKTRVANVGNVEKKKLMDSNEQVLWTYLGNLKIM